jgi:hypothetical protein
MDLAAPHLEVDVLQGVHAGIALVDALEPQHHVAGPPGRRGLVRSDRDAVGAGGRVARRAGL